MWNECTYWIRKSRICSIRPNRMTWCVLVAALLAATSCSRRSEPAQDPEPEAIRVPEPITGKTALPAVAADGETDWNARYIDHYQKYEREFVPPPLLESIHLTFRSGKPISGTLITLEPDHFVLGIPSGEIEYPRAMLSSESLARLYAEHYAKHSAVRDVRREQQQEKEIRNPRPAAIEEEEVADGEEPGKVLDPPEGSQDDLAGPPENDPVDGSVREVMDYLSATVRDPTSLEYLSWSDVIKGENGYRVVCTYRARAGKFGIVTEKKVFFMNERGGITNVSAVRQNL